MQATSTVTYVGGEGISPCEEALILSVVTKFHNLRTDQHESELAPGALFVEYKLVQGETLGSGTMMTVPLCLFTVTSATSHLAIIMTCRNSR